MNDRHLIINLKKRPQKALDILISSYSAYVYTIARNILGGAFTAEDAEEIASDVFFRIWQTADSLDESRSISPYLAACTRNCAIGQRARISNAASLWRTSYPAAALKMIWKTPSSLN